MLSTRLAKRVVDVIDIVEATECELLMRGTRPGDSAAKQSKNKTSAPRGGRGDHKSEPQQRTYSTTPSMIIRPSRAGGKLTERY